jgi:hypothetical protein
VSARIREGLAGALLVTVGAWPAFGQTEPRWIDPPASVEPPAPPQSDAPPQRGAATRPAEATPSAEPARPRQSAERPVQSAPQRGSAAGAPAPLAGPSLERAARQLAVDYLDFWSAPNSLALETMPDFYGSRVEFHGRDMSIGTLMEEKRRFVRRWPVRSYTARLDTLRASCAPSGDTCAVRGVFDYTAISPERGRRSQGVANLELQISFAGERPVIVSETSRVVARGRAQAAAAFDDVDD